ncbi:MAG: hypothetical protein ACLPX5_13620, partial [Dissulfurispiraceae bacterium]
PRFFLYFSVSEVSLAISLLIRHDYDPIVHQVVVIKVDGAGIPETVTGLQSTCSWHYRCCGGKRKTTGCIADFAV